MMLSVIHTFFLGSKTARFVAVSVAAIIGLFGYGKWKEYNGARVVTAKIIAKSNKVAIKRNAKVRKVRRRIERGGAHKRLLEDFARSNSD